MLARPMTIILVALLAVPQPALSQQPPERGAQPRRGVAPPPFPGPAVPGTPPRDPKRSPVVLPPHAPLPAGLQAPERLEALETFTAWSAIALGASGAVASMVMLQRARNNTNYEERQTQARAAGTTLMGAAATAAAGVGALQEKKQREAQELKARQEKLFGPPAPSLNPALMALEADAERAKKRRNNWATVTALAGILAGGLVSTIPVALEPQPDGSRRPVDIVPYVSGGALVLAAGLGAAWYLWRSDPEEVEVYEEAIRPSE
ncbi:MAG: hypothetical protein AAGI01_05835 [Myxococcota bacterium]